MKCFCSKCPSEVEINSARDEVGFQPASLVQNDMVEARGMSIYPR